MASGRPSILDGQRPSFLVNRSPRNSGFSLLEVIAAMGLIMFLVGGVYGIADGTLKLSTSMSRARISEARLTNFTNQWRSCLENLPPGTKLTANSKSGKSGESRLLLENCGAPFAWSRNALAAAAVEFAVARNDSGNSRLMVRHLKRPERATTGDEYYTIAELPLLEDIRTCTWDFFDPSTKEWTSKWDDPSRLPLFLRMRWSLSDDTAVHESVFWMANDLPNPAATPQPATAIPNP